MRVWGLIIVPVLDGILVVNGDTATHISYQEIVGMSLTPVPEKGEIMFDGLPYAMGEAYLPHGGKLSERSLSRLRGKFDADQQELISRAREAHRRNTSRTYTGMEGVSSGVREKNYVRVGEGITPVKNGGYRVRSPRVLD